jgi:predicted lipoprotein with Yx(FWY)xxD motif
MRRLPSLTRATRPPGAVLWTFAVLAIGLVATGCGAAVPSSNGGAAAVKLMHSQNGRVLVDSKGHSLYLFEKDEDGESYCNGACAAVWPPYETESANAAGDMSSSAIGTFKRSDGDLQVTYHGHPLYYYAADASTPGKTKGEGLKQFGSEWYLVDQSGKPVEEQSDSGDSGGSGGSGGPGGSGGSSGGGGY